jgi:hypothetical protein
MPVIKIDGQDYDYDSLPEAAKKQLQCLQFVEAELIRLDNQRQSSRLPVPAISMP